MNPCPFCSYTPSQFVSREFDQCVMVKQHWEERAKWLELNSRRSITQLVKAAHENAVDKGFYGDTPELVKVRAFCELLALAHSELSEALEEYRTRGFDIMYREDGKPEGVEYELADTVIRIFDMCGYYGFDLETAINEKMAFNKTRPYKHGGKKL